MMTVCWTEVGFYLLRCVIYLSTNQVLLHKTSLYILFKVDLVVIVPHWEINSVTINTLFHTGKLIQSPSI